MNRTPLLTLSNRRKRSQSLKNTNTKDNKIKQPNRNDNKQNIQIKETTQQGIFQN